MMKKKTTLLVRLTTLCQFAKGHVPAQLRRHHIASHEVFFFFFFFFPINNEMEKKSSLLCTISRDAFRLYHSTQLSYSLQRNKSNYNYLSISTIHFRRLLYSQTEHPTSHGASSMQLSTEAIVAILGLIISLPPILLILVRLCCRYRSHRKPLNREVAQDKLHLEPISRGLFPPSSQPIPLNSARQHTMRICLVVEAGEEDTHQNYTPVWV
ncbi:hypothetical protein F5Y09DRAFT_143383 [Xylaria sp. FL1042]|nr:hypothetical protein F5Y09DRAFT_143383 [Xylaria sp. FL1042]